MLLGYNTNGFCHHRLEDAIKIIAGLGYECIAITLDHSVLNPFDHGLPGRLEETRLLLEGYGLRSVIETGARFLLDPWKKHSPTLISQDRDGRRMRRDFLKRAIDIAAFLDAGCVSFWSGKKEAEVESARAWEWLVSACRELSDYGRDKGVFLAFEPEPGMYVEDMTQFQQLKKDVDSDSFRLALDLGHAFLTEPGPVGNCIRQNIADVKNVHLEDMRCGVHEHCFFGEGEMDFCEIMRSLEETAYAGPICIELSRHSHDAVSVAKSAKEFLDEIRGRITKMRTLGEIDL